MGQNVRDWPRRVLSPLQQSVRAVKNLRGSPDGFVGTDQDGFATVTHLGSGTPSSATVLRGDGTWGAATGSLGDGDYTDIEVSSSGTVWTVEQYANRFIVEIGTNLQSFIDGVGTAATIILDKGTYYADSGTPSTPLTITSSHDGLRIIGQGDDHTIIASPILIETTRVGFEHLWVRPDGTAYGMKIFKSGSFLSRCWLKKVRIGATSQGAGNGPVDGLVLDGAGLLIAEHCNISFNEGEGLLVDSTAAEPNTTLKFNMCTFNGNGTYGIKLMGSCSIAEFLNGNAENNVSGELYAEAMNNLRIIGFDFETSGTNITNQVEIQNCNPIEIVGCNFLTDDDGSGADRAIFIVGQGITIASNRFAGYGAVGVVRIGETSQHANCYGNVINTDVGKGWFEDYSRP